MNTDNNVKGISLAGWMFLLFLGLKLTGVITWSWWWVTAPLWGPVGLFLVTVAVLALVYRLWNR